MRDDSTLISIKGLKTYFFLNEGTVKAVDGVSFDLNSSGTVGIVGESGCGKSVLARSIMRIVQPPGRTVEGEIYYYRSAESQSGSDQSGDVVDLCALDPDSAEMRRIRGGDISMIFQEPMASLSPVHTVGAQIVEGIRLNRHATKNEARDMAIQMLGRVGIPDPETRVDEYSFRLSGGMRQRSMIAMALACSPRLLIADEPTTALDMTTQAQILDLMRELQLELGMAMILITHNLGVVAQMSQHIIVMYLGKIVESADVKTLFRDPKHPYTRELLKSIPKLSRTGQTERLAAISGSVPPPFERPTGCPFHPRCPQFMAGTCDAIDPAPVEVGPEHTVSCLLYSEPDQIEVSSRS